MGSAAETSVVVADHGEECALVDEADAIELAPVDLGCPVLVGSENMERLKKEVLEDASLRHCRELAKSGKMGFHRIVDEVLGVCERLVLPKVRRDDVVMRLAHDQTGHVGSKKMRELINDRFTWPGLCADVEVYVGSCETCLKYNKVGNRQVQMMERPVIAELFESVAVDTVGPLPKGKGGARFLLTYICMASRWPEATPMRTGSASEVAEGLVGIFTRSGFPLKVLSDRGSVFMRKVFRRVAKILGIDTIQSSPYRP